MRRLSQSAFKSPSLGIPGFRRARLIGISLGIAYAATAAADAYQRGNDTENPSSPSHQAWVGTGSLRLKREAIEAGEEARPLESGANKEAEEDCE